jgi:prevent-host-death family protein
VSLSTQIKPISYLKSHAAEIVKDFTTNPEPLIITQNGEAKMVVMDIAEYERQQETLALLKLVSMGKKRTGARPRERHGRVFCRDGSNAMTRRIQILDAAKPDFRDIQRCVVSRFGQTVWQELNQEFKNTLCDIGGRP